MTEMENKYPDEIELIDIIKVIWKWRYLITAGSLICGLVAGLISYSTWKNTPQMYNTTMILKPGIKSTDNAGKKEYFDSPINIKTLIEEELKYKVLTNIEVKGENSSAVPLEIETTVPNNLNLLQISCKSDNPDVGTKVLNNLSIEISDAMSEKIHDEIKKKRDKIKEIKRMLQNKKKEADKNKKQISIMDNRINEIRSKLDFVEDNTKKILLQESELTQKRDQNNAISSLVYLNIIQQNIGLENQYRSDIYSYRLAIEDIRFELGVNLNELEKIQTEIEELSEITSNENSTSILNENSKNTQNSIKAVHIIQSPIVQPVEKQNKIKLAVIMSVLTGSFILVLLAFFIEYIKKYKESI